MLRTPRTDPDMDANPSGSYLGCLTANRRSGHGWRIEARGQSISVMHSIFFQSNRCRWDRRRSAFIHRHCSLRRNTRVNRTAENPTRIKCPGPKPNSSPLRFTGPDNSQGTLTGGCWRVSRLSPIQCQQQGGQQQEIDDDPQDDHHRDHPAQDPNALITGKCEYDEACRQHRACRE